jgi:hypothetical protein
VDSINIEKIQNLGFSTGKITPVNIIAKDDEIFVVINFEGTVKLSSSLQFNTIKQNSLVFKYTNRSIVQAALFEFSKPTAESFVQTKGNKKITFEERETNTSLLGVVEASDTITLLIDYSGELKKRDDCDISKPNNLSSTQTVLVSFDVTNFKCQSVRITSVISLQTTIDTNY